MRAASHVVKEQSQCVLEFVGLDACAGRCRQKSSGGQAVHCSSIYLYGVDTVPVPRLGLRSYSRRSSMSGCCLQLRRRPVQVLAARPCCTLEQSITHLAGNSRLSPSSGHHISPNHDAIPANAVAIVALASSASQPSEPFLPRSKSNSCPRHNRQHGRRNLRGQL